MKKLKTLLFLALGITVMSSCGPTLSPFTQRLYDEYRWSDSELQRIQFYVSRDIELRREVTGGKSEIISGEIKVVDGREVEVVMIRRGTPGVLIFQPKQNRFAISFEDGSDDRYLVFGPNPKASDRYVLLASDWNRNSGVVTYDGRKYRVDSANAYASLMVDLKKVRKVAVKSRTARGRKID